MSLSAQTMLQKCLMENKIIITSHMENQLLMALYLLKQWNKTINLTGIDSMQDMIYLHLLDSLSVNPYLEGTHLLDVGSGAGFPGIPLAVLNPHRQWVLLDQNAKKTAFLITLITKLQLQNVEVVQSQCEKYYPSISFDCILSRAFGSLKKFIDSTAHLLNPHGSFLAMKGKFPQDELADVPHLFHPEIYKLHLSGIDRERHLVKVKKI